jgi:NitT/TauT family transport system substrate-binding protein
MHEEDQVMAKRRRSTAGVVLAAAALMVAACQGGAATAAPSTAVDFLLPSGPGIAFWPAVVADELGYFEEEGLDVTIQGTDGGPFVVQQVAAGASEFGLGAGGSILLGYEQEENYQLVYDFSTHNVFDIWVLEDSDIQSLADLEGRTLGVKDLADGSVADATVLLLKEDLVFGESVPVVTLGEGGAIHAQALLDGTVDAFTVAWDEIPGLRAALEAEGKGLRCIECGAESIRGSQAVMAPKAFIESNPEAVEGMGRALAKARLFGVTNPEAARLIVKGVNPEEQLDDEVARAIFDLALERTAPWEGLRVGEVSQEAWDRTMQVLLLPGSPTALTGPIDLGAAINNSFVDAYQDFDATAVEQEARDYQPSAQPSAS